MFRSHGSGVARDVTTQASKVDGKVEGGQGLRGGPIQCVQSVCDECVMREHDSRESSSVLRSVAKMNSREPRWSEFLRGFQSFLPRRTDVENDQYCKTEPYVVGTLLWRTTRPKKNPTSFQEVVPVQKTWAAHTISLWNSVERHDPRTQIDFKSYKRHGLAPHQLSHSLESMTKDIAYTRLNGEASEPRRPNKWLFVGSSICIFFVLMGVFCDDDDSYHNYKRVKGHHRDQHHDKHSEHGHYDQ